MPGSMKSNRGKSLVGVGPVFCFWSGLKTRAGFVILAARTGMDANVGSRAPGSLIHNGRGKK